MKQPDGGVRRVEEVELELKTADHRMLKILRGGQINLTIHGQLVEYEAPELFLRQGEQVEVIVSRKSLAQVTVLDGRGERICDAKAKPLYDWLPDDRDELRAVMRCKAAMHRAVKRGLAASEALELAPNPLQLLEAARERSLPIAYKYFEAKAIETRKRRPEPMKFANDHIKELAALL